MRFLVWTASVWSLMFLGIVTIDVGYTVYTGKGASPTVTERINFSPEKGGVIGMMGRVSRHLDKTGDRAFGPVTPLVEMIVYGLLTPLLIAGPIGWEAHRQKWSTFLAGGITGSAGLLIVGWALSKFSLTAIYYSMVRVLFLCCRALGFSYYAGSLLYFVLLPPTIFLSYLLYHRVSLA